MLFVFFDDRRVVAVLDSAFVMDYGTNYVDHVPEGGGALQRLNFSRSCQMIRTTEATACTLFAGTTIDTAEMDDFILSLYAPAEPAK